jgi:hypothetical protein
MAWRRPRGFLTTHVQSFFEITGSTETQRADGTVAAPRQNIEVSVDALFA